MNILNVDQLLQAIDPAEPCGPNLEYDPQFSALEQAIQGKPEVQYGDTITPAVPPEWKVVKALALDLLARSQDLRVALPLVRAALALHGIPGLADGLLLVQRLLEERWDDVHPQLDPDDDLDPMQRINSLSGLADLGSTIQEMKQAALLVLPRLGPFSMRDLERALGELPTPEGGEKPALDCIEQALRDTDLPLPPERLEAALDALRQACDAVAAIEKALLQRVGASQTLNLDPLGKNLRRARDFLAGRHAAAGLPGQAGPESDAPDNPPPAGAAPQTAQAGGTALPPGKPFAPNHGISGEINSREDVSCMIDKICSYYQKCEPSSPVPLLLVRAKRLVNKSFMEIMEDLAPEGVAQVSVISGVGGNSDGQ